MSAIFVFVRLGARISRGRIRNFPGIEQGGGVGGKVGGKVGGGWEGCGSRGREGKVWTAHKVLKDLNWAFSVFATTQMRQESV